MATRAGLTQGPQVARDFRRPKTRGQSKPLFHSSKLICITQFPIVMLIPDRPTARVTYAVVGGALGRTIGLGLIGPATWLSGCPSLSITFFSFEIQG